MACSRKSITNNQPSQLFEDIYNNLANKNEEVAENMWLYFRSDTFKDEFGDWENEYKEYENDLLNPNRDINPRLLDDNGEPKLFYDRAKAKYYYVSKIGRKIYYPNNINKLDKYFSHEHIRNITKILALKFLQPRLNDNFQDIDLSEMKGTLSESIKDILSKKAEELQNSDDFDLELKGEYLEQSLYYLDEWIRNVENFYRELKLVYNENTETEDMIEDSESTRSEPSFGKASFEKASKDNLTANVKLRLSLLTSKENDPIFNEPTFIPFDEVYSTLQKVLTNNVALEGEDLFDIYYQEIVKLQDKKPFLEELKNQFSNIPDYEKAQFVQAFNLDRNNFIGTDIEITPIYKSGDVVGYTTSVVIKNLSNAGGKNRLVKNNWFNNFIKNFTDGSNEFNAEGKNKFNSIKTHYNTAILEIKQNLAKDNIELEQQALDLLQVLSKLGIVTTDLSVINHYLDGLQSDNATFEVRLENFKKLIRSTDYFFKNFNFKEIEDNPFDEQGEFSKLAEAQSFYLKEGSDASFFSVGKNKWLFSYPTYLSTKLKQWKKNPDLLMHHYTSSPYNLSSSWIQYLLALDVNESERGNESKIRLQEFELNVFNSLQEPGDSINAVDNVNMSKNDAYNDTFNKLLQFKIGKKSYVSTPIPADKASYYQFSVPKDMMADTAVTVENGQVKVNTATQKIIYNHIKAEFNRIKKVEKEIELGENLTVNYHTESKNGLKFQLFPSLNRDNFKADVLGFELYNEGKLIDFELQNIDDMIDLSELPSDSVAAKLLAHVNSVLSTNIKQVRNHLQEINVLERIDGEWINKGFSSDIWNAYGESNIKTLKIAGDIFINSLIGKVEFSKMFSGDFAYYKDMADYNKRSYSTQTSGKQLYLKEGQEYFNAAIIESVKISIPNLKDLEKMVGKEIADHYANVNSADGQAWITPERWKFLKQGVGDWNNIDDIVYDKLTKKNKEPFTEAELKRAAQPLKGTYFEINDGVPIFLKYSQAVMLPDLIANNKGLKALYDHMVKYEVDELITVDGIKVGSNIPTITHNEDGSVKESFELTPIRLKNSGWKLQQDLPVKTDKDTDIGSQIQKNIFVGLAKLNNSTFNVDGVEMNNIELMTHIHNLFNTLSDKGLESLFDELGIDSNYNITNVDKLYASLINELKSRGAAQNVIDALESGITIYAVPGYQDKIQNVFASMVLKRVIKIQTNGGSYIQMSNYGFSNEQANNKGVIWTPWAEDTTHEPTIIEEEIIDENGDIIKKAKIKPGGILISGSFIAKYIPNYRDYVGKKGDTSKLFGTAENNYTDGMIDKKILENIIGYRIPNQGLASNDALEIVGILPEGMGDTVVAYTGITKKTGSDFDIDKMYIMMPSFKPQYKTHSKVRKYIRDNFLRDDIDESIENLNNILDELGVDSVSIDLDKNDVFEILNSTYKGDDQFQNILVNDLTTAIVRSNSELAVAVKTEIPDIAVVEGLKYIDNDSKEGLQNKIIQAYKAVLTHPDNMKSIMTPIDFEHVKDDILDLHPEPKGSDLSDFNIINEINKRYEFIAGKAGVGIDANQLVDHIRGLSANFRIPYLNIGKSIIEKNKKGNDVYLSKLDNEYSEPLTDKEVKYYENEINKNRKEKDKIDASKLKSIKIADAISAILNANVDIAKDSYITRGNWTTQTSNIGLMLIRAGIHPFKVNAILGNPIIKEYVDYVVNSKSILVGEKGEMIEKFKEKKILEELGDQNIFEPVTFNNKTVGYRDLYLATKYEATPKRLSKLFGRKAPPKEIVDEIINKIKPIVDKYNPPKSEISLNSVSLKKLRDQIKTDNIDIKLSLNILQNFQNWNEISKDVVNNINASKQDVNGYGKNATSLILNRNLVNKMMLGHSSFKGFSSKMTFNGQDTFLKGYTRNSITEILKVMQANPLNFITAQPIVINTFNTISKSIKDEVLLDQKLADKLDKAYYTYIMSGFAPLETTLESREQLLKSIPNRVETAKKNYPNNALLNELEPKQGNLGRTFIGMSNRQKSPATQTEITNGWKDLLKNNKELGEDLIRYAFITSGFNNSINQFHTYIPYEVFAENDINGYINGIVDTLQNMESNVDMSFMENFFKHNINDNQIVPTMFPNEILKGKDIQAGFIVEEKGTKPLYVKRIVEDIEANTTFKLLYKLEGYDNNKRAVYTRVNILGTRDKRGNRVVEFSFNTMAAIPTMLRENKLYNLVERTKEGELIDKRTYFKDLVETDLTIGTVNEKEVDNLKDNQENEINDIDDIDNQGNNIKPKVDTTASWSKLKSQPVYTEQGVNTMRTSNKEAEYAHFGNPFSEGGYAGTIKVSSVKDAMQAYKDWLLNPNFILGFDISIPDANNNSNAAKELKTINPEQRQWILDQINSGKLDNATLLYDSKLADRGQGTHAHALAEVISEIRNKNINSNKGQLSLFDQIDDVFLNDDNC